jgi:DNA-binding NarL/FixJ family response regulator
MTQDLKIDLPRTPKKRRRAIAGPVHVELSDDKRYYVIRIPRRALEEFDPEGEPELAKPLTSRQEVVLELVRAGKCNKEIAATLNLSLRGVKHHISLLLQRFGVDSRVGLLRPVLRSDTVAEQRGTHEENTRDRLLTTRRAS